MIFLKLYSDTNGDFFGLAKEHGTIQMHGDTFTVSVSLSYPDRDRVQILFNRYGSKGMVIIFTGPYQIQGNNLQLNCHYYGLIYKRTDEWHLDISKYNHITFLVLPT